MISSSDILHGKVLIVDDQDANVLLLEQMLRGAGYVAVTSTMDPGEVCALHAKNRYDLILLDLEMPDMDGFQVMEGLKKIETDGYLPVLAVTAQPAHKLRALQSGAKDFISKPFDLAEVLMRVHNMLEVRLLHEATRNHGKMLEALALTDPLTGLANRRLLAERLSTAIVHARRNNSTMAVVYLDLDGFKQINNTMGHGAGDLLLKMVAARLTATVREEDTVARLGGDEFVIMLWNITCAGRCPRGGAKSHPGGDAALCPRWPDRPRNHQRRYRYLSHPWRGRGHAHEVRRPGHVRGQARRQERLSNRGACQRQRAVPIETCSDTPSKTIRHTDYMNPLEE